MASYEYDGDNKRVHRTTSGGDNLRYLWSGSEIVKEYNADNSVKAQYLMGMGREAIKVDGQWHFYGADRLGTTRFLTNSTGAKSATYEYDSYGFETTSGQTVYNPFRYTGQQWDSGENHLYLRNRYYYSGLCKFLVRDPIRYDAGTNLYAYCGNNPINCADPSGLEPLLGPKAQKRWGPEFEKAFDEGIEQARRRWKLFGNAPFEGIISDGSTRQCRLVYNYENFLNGNDDLIYEWASEQFFLDSGADNEAVMFADRDGKHIWMREKNLMYEGQPFDDLVTTLGENFIHEPTHVYQMREDPTFYDHPERFHPDNVFKYGVDAIPVDQSWRNK